MYLTRLFLSITSDRGFKNISPVEFQFFFSIYYVYFSKRNKWKKKKMTTWIYMYRYLLKLVRLVKIIAII